jgi:M-phase inducer tyrosine phosphatase
MRRSLSMFENPGDVVGGKKDDEPVPCTLQAVVDVEEAHECQLPHFFNEGPGDSIPRIHKTTFLEVMDGKYNTRFDQKLVIDCRFEYEYEGGHIDGAINYNDKELLATHLFGTPMTGNTLIVLHCEYSAHRAPIMARHIRAKDRAVNAESYPKLTYPEVYILDGGYSGFFAEHRERCYPQAYVEMGAAEHVNTCEREMGRLKQTRKGLNRAKTFAFGQKDSCMDSSPTAPGRPPFELPIIGNMDSSPLFDGDRLPTRRMASY